MQQRISLPVCLTRTNHHGQVLLKKTEIVNSLPLPEEADGKGYTLVAYQPESDKDWDDANNWRLSAKLGGSPFENDENSERYTNWTLSSR